MSGCFIAVSVYGLLNDIPLANYSSLWLIAPMIPARLTVRGPVRLYLANVDKVGTQVPERGRECLIFLLFSLYIDETPVLIDAGVGTYTRQTFGDERYTIWTMQSLFHNLPEINGTQQAFGAK